MSDILYPLAGFDRLDVRLFDRTVADEFEDGSTTARRLWSAQYFKRRFEVQHMALTEAEFAYLRSFFAARSGRYDSFWFRDNVHRTGNAKVRLATEFPLSRAGTVYRPQLTLEEVAPIRALPDAAELNDSLIYPLALYDPNRQRFWLHAGAYYFDQVMHDSSGYGRNLAWYDSTTFPFNNTAAQYCNANASLAFGSTSVVAGTVIAAFMVAKALKRTPAKVIASFGAEGTRTAIGLQTNNTNIFPYIGSNVDVFTNAKVANDEGWHTWAVNWDVAGGAVSLYKDGALVGTDSSLAFGVIASGVGLRCTPVGGDGMTGNLGPVMFLANNLDLAMVKILHNLYGPQYGLAAV